MLNRKESKWLAFAASLALAMMAMPNAAWSAPTIPASDEETILVDKQPSTKVPYGKLARAVIYKLFNFDSEQLMTFGGDSRSDVARRFSDYLDRSKTKFKVKEDELEIEFKVHF